MVAVFGPEEFALEKAGSLGCGQVYASPKPFQAPNHVPVPGAPVSKMAGNTRPNSSVFHPLFCLSRRACRD